MASFDANISDLTLLHSVRRTVTTLINFLSSILVLANLGWHMAAQIVRLLLFHFNQIQTWQTWINSLNLEEELEVLQVLHRGLLPVPLHPLELEAQT